MQPQLSPRMARAIEIMDRLFGGRRDCYGQHRPHGDRGICVKQPITTKVWYDHLFGASPPIGVYPMTSDGEIALTAWFCIDIDREGNLEEALEIARKILDAGRPYARLYPERSKGKGVHIWCFHEPAPAWQSRAVGRHMLKLANVDEGQDSKGNEVVVFPKQDQVKPGDYGNFVYCPWWGPLVKEGRSAFLNPGSLQPYPEQIEAMADVVPMTALQIRQLVEIHGLEPSNVTKIKKPERATAPPPPPPATEPAKAARPERVKGAAQPGAIDALTDEEFARLTSMLEALRRAVGNPAGCPYNQWVAALIHMVPFQDGYARARDFSSADSERFNGAEFEKYWQSAVRSYEKDHAVHPRKSQLIIEDWRHGGRFDVEPITDRYGFWKGCLVERNWKVQSGERVEQHPTVLTNFTARITHQEHVDDGAGTAERRVRLEGQLANGRPLKSTDVAGKDWSEIKRWMAEKWGTDPIVWVDAGDNRYARVQEALALTGLQAPNRHVFTHSGWATINGKRAFLTSGNIAACDDETAKQLGENAEVRLPEELSRYSVAREVTLPEAMNAYKLLEKFIRCADMGTTAPLVATLFLAPLASHMSIDLMVGIIGKTGMRKSSLVAAALSAYSTTGFTRKSLPLSFRSSANYIERIAFSAKDLPIVIDNYKPDKKGEALNTLERIAHSIGDGAARGRMRRDESISSSKPTRGVVIVTGEDMPEGSSSVNRMYTVTRTNPNSLHLTELGDVQDAAARGELAPAMTHYISWLASKLEDPKFISSLQARYDAECRANAGEAQEHGRLAEQTAWIKLGLDLAVESHPIGGWIHRPLEHEMLEAINHEAAERRVGSNEVSLSFRFMTALRVAVKTGVMCGVDRRTGFRPQKRWAEWGWRDDGSVEGAQVHRDAHRLLYVDRETPYSFRWSLYLEPEAIFAVLREKYRNSLAFLDSERAVRNALEADGIFEPSNESGHKCSKTSLWDGTSPRCWKLKGNLAWKMLGLDTEEEPK